MNKTKVLGFLAMILGVLALFSPMVTGLSIAFAVGILVVIAGITRLYWAFQASSMGNMFLLFLLGILTLVCGIAMLSNTYFAAAVLTILLATYFILDGVLEISAGLTYRQLSGYGWMIFAGIVSILLGILIIAQSPFAGIWAIGILFGIKLFFIGLIMVMNGSSMAVVQR
jgi:uncharacterized membrane protein HdeD (DUF308 family)